MRIGQGFDVHRFCDGNHIILGGVRIPHDHALLAHSDGDVLIHALCDALLGSLALGDIGKHFPDTDQEFANIDSQILLKQCYSLLLERGWKLVNADCTLVAQSPKMAPYITAMQETLATNLNIAIDDISIKATTTETLGFTGRNEGIAAYATVLIES
ncbi:MAG: 2-C-methyl-D-erythritol 2,4-cyclodiphosphate synthase [Thiotrichaceae bacterium]|nr:2-C-methyl-D-erythritol 2,4-cyclodiphosphate synthase [Thiotrichaceae bacterium]